jgi:hypothetical protein
MSSLVPIYPAGYDPLRKSCSSVKPHRLTNPLDRALTAGKDSRYFAMDKIILTDKISVTEDVYRESRERVSQRK